jgi:hypothetical protein
MRRAIADEEVEAGTKHNYWRVFSAILWRESARMLGFGFFWRHRRESPLQGAVAPACATRSHGATHALRNPVLTPRPCWTRLRFP